MAKATCIFVQKALKWPKSLLAHVAIATCASAKRPLQARVRWHDASQVAWSLLPGPISPARLPAPSATPTLAHVGFLLRLNHRQAALALGPGSRLILPLGLARPGSRVGRLNRALSVPTVHSLAHEFSLQNSCLRMNSPCKIRGVPVLVPVRATVPCPVLCEGPGALGALGVQSLASHPGPGS